MLDNKITINKKELKKILKSYYEDKYNTSVEIYYDVSIGDRFTSSWTKIKYVCTKKIGSLIGKIECVINEEELKQIINELISTSEYEVDNLYLKTETCFIGYYDDESLEFKELVCNLKLKEPEMKLSMK